MGKSVHDHRRAAGIPRASRQVEKTFFCYQNEDLIFDERRESCGVEIDFSVRSKNREEQIFVRFLDVKKVRVVTAFDGSQYERTPILRLSLKDVKQRLRDYQCYNERMLSLDENSENLKDTSPLVAAKLACKREYPTHCPRLV